MKKIKGFDEYLNESKNSSSLHKIYLATKRSSGQAWLSYKGFAGNNFFVQVTENNLDKININKDYPIINYHSDIIKELLKLGKIKEENIINHPNYIKLSGSKTEFHKLVEGDENVPQTFFYKEDALKNLDFPIIAKPKSGHSGIGITVVKSKDEFDKLDDSYDLFSEYIDKKEEHRFFTYKGEIFFWMERTPMNDKAKNGNGKSDEAMEFGYTRMNPKNIPNNVKKVIEKFCNKFKKLPYVCFDVMIDKNDKVFIIESNLQPGVPFDSTVKLYEMIYRDFFNEDLSSESKLKLNSYSDVLIAKTIEKNPKRFSVLN